MSALMLANHVTSAVVVLTCWWLAHVSAAARPPGRLIATGYALIGLSVLATALVREIAPQPAQLMPWLIVLSKALLGLTFLLTILRRARCGHPLKGDPDV